MSYLKIVSQKLNKRNDTSRIYIESAKLEQAGLSAGTPISVDVSKQKVVITVAEEGERIITSRKNRPIIDICNKSLTEAFVGVENIVIKLSNDKIVVEPLYEELKRKKAKANLKKKSNIRYMEIFAGGGTLSKAFFDEGFDLRCAVELEKKYIESYEENFPNAMTYCGTVEHIDIRDLPDIDVLAAGIPCEGYSQAGITGRGKNGKNAEIHPTGHLGFFVLSIIKALMPAAVVVEESPNFQKSAMATLTYAVLKSLGYTINETILNANDYGSISKRVRYCMVATLKDEEFEFPKPVPSLFKDTIGDILEIPLTEREWLTEENSSTIAGMKKQERKHQTRGNGFRIAGVESHKTACSTITKGYQKRRLTDPVLTDGKGGYSFFTPRELASINGLPRDFIIPEHIKSTSSEIIGQGVCYHPFRAVAKQIKTTVFGK